MNILTGRGVDVMTRLGGFQKLRLKEKVRQTALVEKLNPYTQSRWLLC